MNYLFLGGRLLYLQYAYVDLNTDSAYVADSLFYRHKVPVKFEEELARDGEEYRVIFCKIRKKYKNEFEKALGEIENKMYLLGHNDYGAFCDKLMQIMQKRKSTTQH